MSHAEKLLRGLAAFQVRHPLVLLGAVALTCIPAYRAATSLKLRTDWTELLPENKRSIQDLRRIQERMGGSGTLTVVLEADDTEAMERFAEDLAARLSRLPAGQIKYLDKDIRDERAFFESNRWLYADTAALARARDGLRARIRDEKAKAAFDLGLDDEEETPPEPAPAAAAAGGGDGLDLGELKQRYDEALARLARYPRGYFVGEDGHVLALFVRSATTNTNFKATEALLTAVKQAVAELDPARYAPSLKVAYTGSLITTREEHEAIRDELLVVTLICSSLILASIYFFYFEVRAIFVLGASTLIGCLWTFGLTALHIGYLSSATAFLASIVPGNGINSGIMLIARYLEERRGGAATADAIPTALVGTWTGTLSAASAAALAYGALMLTDFRGFSQFGFIGATGLLSCWLSNYLVIPALLVLTQRRKTRAVRSTGRRGNYGGPFLWLSERAPVPTLVLATLTALGGAVVGWRWLTHDPFEYDFRKLRNERSRVSGAGKLQSRVNSILEGRPREGMVVLADRPDQVGLLEDELVRVREDAGRSGRTLPIGDIRSVHALVPRGQAEKLELLREIRELALGILPRLSPAKRAELEPWVPPEDLRELTLADVPSSLKRPFIEKDGTAGLVVYVAPPAGVSVWDGRGLQRFANAVREVRLPNGEVVHSSGQPVIFADMIESIVTDGPKLTLASFAGIAILVAITFRRLLYTSLALYALLVGVSWMVGITALSGQKLNFLNFIALPITFGIGVDYATNILQRYVEEGWSATRQVLLETGGAVILCSMTTVWGYLSLLYSDNQALRSFGKLAVLGELSCLVAGVIVLPSAVKILAARGVSAGR